MCHGQIVGLNHKLTDSKSQKIKINFPTDLSKIYHGTSLLMIIIADSIKVIKNPFEFSLY